MASARAVSGAGSAPVTASSGGHEGHRSVTAGGVGDAAGGSGESAGGGGSGAATASTTESWSFVPTRSLDDVTTRAVLVRDSPPAAASTVAVTRISVDASALSSSRRQVTLRPETEHSPSSAPGVRDTRSPAGRRSVTTTLRAVDGPALETLSLKTTSSPTSAVELETLFRRLTSVSTTTGVETVSALSASSGSRVGEDTDAVLVRAPRAPPATVALMVILAVCRSAREPSAQATVWSVLIGAQVPTVVVTDASSRSASSRSVTVTPWAVIGPALCTLIV